RDCGQTGRCTPLPARRAGLWTRRERRRAQAEAFVSAVNVDPAPRRASVGGSARIHVSPIGPYCTGSARALVFSPSRKEGFLRSVQRGADGPAAAPARRAPILAMPCPYCQGNAACGHPRAGLSAFRVAYGFLAGSSAGLT